ncbi:Uncharacterised protein [Mycobacteroides abscessus subsp. abscessus]|nr:Uncharacterised protein [Mycobacteroides abscessus subsp. abscessus]SIG65030.1 Uncharacterised protein [Mycobacteroides abscessus subsp. abscessus]
MEMTDYIEPTDEVLLAALAAADQRITELENADTITEEPTA